MKKRISSTGLGYSLRWGCTALLLHTFISYASAQAINIEPGDSLNKKRLKLVVIGTGAAYTATMITLSQVWYSNFDKQSFSFFDDSNEWMQVDKVGHFYAAFQLNSMASRALQWTGLPKGKSDRISAITSFAMMSSIEVFDGFSSGFGASASDLVANGLGVSLYLGQQALWNDIRIHPKFSFSQTQYAALRPNVLGDGLKEELIKDYNGQTYWLSVDMDKFMAFPKWLNLAIGYGAEEMIFATESANRSNGFDPHRQFYLGLDFDIHHIQTRSKALKTLLYFVNMVRLPAPAIEFSRRGTNVQAFTF